MNLPFNMQNGSIIFEHLFMATDLVALDLSGQIGLDKNVRTHGAVRMQNQLSGTMAQLVPQLQYLANAQGETEVPLQINGVFPHLAVLPDMDYLTGRLLASTAEELLNSQVLGGNGLKNLLKRIP